MAALLPSPELQFCDANGAPYAAGSLAFYIPGTTVPKATWSEPTGTALNTNPLILDAAGRCIVWADGAYRMVLQDNLGNTIFDQTTSTTVSSAMAPITLAADIPTAVALLGIPGLITAATVADAAAWTAAIAGEAVIRQNGDAAEATSRTTEDTAIIAALSAETTRAEAAEAAIIAAAGFPSGERLQFGNGTTNTAGAATITFPIAFSSTPSVVMSVINTPSGCTFAAYAITTASFIAFTSKDFTTGDGLGPVDFSWIAIGGI